MSGVRESLMKAFRSSAQKVEMFMVWTPEFPLALREMLPPGGSVIDAAVSRVLDVYSERDVLIILARTRLEGKWKPE